VTNIFVGDFLKKVYVTIFYEKLFEKSFSRSSKTFLTFL